MSDNHGNSVFLQDRPPRKTEERDGAAQAPELQGVVGGLVGQVQERPGAPWKDTPPTACCRLVSLALRWAGRGALSRSPGTWGLSFPICRMRLGPHLRRGGGASTQ